MSDILDSLYHNHENMRAFFLEQNEISFVTELEETSPKVMLLAAASYFESLVTACILDFYDTATGSNELARAFVEKKALQRQYHALFNWDTRAPNQFWSLFGKGFKKYASDRLAADDDLTESAAAFLEIGSLRNQLVHGNFASFMLNKTTSELYELAQRALQFVGVIATFMQEYVPVVDD